MEAVGAAAAIIQLAGVGLTLARTLYGLYGEGASCNEQVKELSFYVKSTSIALEAVGNVFQEESNATKPLISANAIITANDVVSRCTDIFNKLGKIAEDGQKSTLSLLVFPLKSSRLQVLQTRLEQSKLDLQLMMQVIIYARLKVEPRYSATTTNTIVDEPAQRKVVKDLIVERAAVYEKECQEDDIEEPNSVPKPNDLSSSSSPSSLAHQNPTSAFQTLCVNDSSPFPAPLPRPPNSSIPPVTESRQGKDPSSSGEGNRTSPNDADISYWVALYLVCCPCLTRKKSPRTKSRHHFVVEHPRQDISIPQAMNSSGSPGLLRMSSPPMAPYHPMMNAPQSLSPPAVSQYPPQVPCHPISELAADPYPICSPIYQAPVHPSQTPIYEYPDTGSPSYSPVYDSAVPVPVPPSGSSEEDTHNPEVDRLLHEWTTIYD